MSTTREILHRSSDVVLPRKAPLPADVYGAFDRWAVLERALHGLAPIHRAVLVMHDFIGYDGYEVAGALRILLKTVNSRLFVARFRVRKLAGAALGATRPSGDTVPATSASSH